MDCKKFESELTDIILTPGATPSVAAAAHMKVCPPCAEEYLSFQQTFSLLDSWQAPAASPYFDQKLAVLLREEQAAPPMGWFERLATSLRLNTGRNFRPALVGALSLALLIGGGSASFFLPATPVHRSPASASATVNDLQILDRNEQAFQQTDELQQDDDSSSQPAQTASPAAPPSS
jgi:hypothetical protein